MATPFHVIVDDVLDTRPRGLAPYARGVLSAMLATAPPGVRVTGFASSSPQAEYDEVLRLLPGLGDLRRSTLAHRELAAVWQHGFTPPIGGMVHSPSLFAPLSSRGDQTVVTVHDAIAWIEPDTVEGSATWYRNMAKRAERFAIAIIVPSYAVAAAFEERGMFAERMRVIPGGVTPGLVVPDDAAERRRALRLPEHYVTSTATLNPRKGLRELLDALRDVEVPLVLLGDPAWRDAGLTEALEQAGIDPSRVTAVEATDVEDRAVVLDGASVFIEPSRLEGFGADVLDAMSLGTAVITTDDPALVELVVDAARIVARDQLKPALGAAIAELLQDDVTRDRLAIAGQDRSRAFSWRDSAERIWQLHADA